MHTRLTHWPIANGYSLPIKFDVCCIFAIRVSDDVLHFQIQLNFFLSRFVVFVMVINRVVAVSASASSQFKWFVRLFGRCCTNGHGHGSTMMMTTYYAVSVVVLQPQWLTNGYNNRMDSTNHTKYLRMNSVFDDVCDAINAVWVMQVNCPAWRRKRRETESRNEQHVRD